MSVLATDTPRLREKFAWLHGALMTRWVGRGWLPDRRLIRSQPFPYPWTEADVRAMHVIRSLTRPYWTEARPETDRLIREIARAVSGGAWFVVSDGQKTHCPATLELAVLYAKTWWGACTLVDVARACEAEA